MSLSLVKAIGGERVGNSVSECWKRCQFAVFGCRLYNWVVAMVWLSVVVCKVCVVGSATNSGYA
ncbi:hypothetical protein ACERII_16645 [Evansella sp. AB-rgal1]|uniref:hypothetical protein n=1 Tax=Evansella sp. AB-rgal1 TaxID=3242696 RepID=UPI00359E2E15